MIPILYTDSDKILATAGLSSDDLPDEEMLKHTIELELTTDFYLWLPDWATRASTTTTPADRFVADSIVLYCTYYGAVSILESPAFILSKISDGKNAEERLIKDVAATVDRLQFKMNALKQRVLNVIAAGDSTAPPKQFSLSEPGYDPVRGQ